MMRSKVSTEATDPAILSRTGAQSGVRTEWRPNWLSLTSDRSLLLRMPRKPVALLDVQRPEHALAYALLRPQASHTHAFLNAWWRADRHTPQVGHRRAVMDDVVPTVEG